MIYLPFFMVRVWELGSLPYQMVLFLLFYEILLFQLQRSEENLRAFSGPYLYVMNIQSSKWFKYNQNYLLYVPEKTIYYPYYIEYIA